MKRRRPVARNAQTIKLMGASSVNSIRCAVRYLQVYTFSRCDSIEMLQFHTYVHRWIKLTECSSGTRPTPSPPYTHGLNKVFVQMICSFPFEVFTHHLYLTYPLSNGDDDDANKSTCISIFTQSTYTHKHISIVPI